LHPDYAHNGWIYISYSDGPEIRSTLAVDRIRLNEHRVTDRARVFTADAWSEITWHCGGRMQFLDGDLFVTIGDRHHPERSQELSNHSGTIVRLNDDGSVPADNPFVESADSSNPAKPEIWSYGHRNPQGFWADAETGELWAHEHGPRGGDELNRIERGANYGWPVVSFGFEYDGGPIGMGITTREDIREPVWVYVPSIAPSDLVIYRGAAFPTWQGSLLTTALALTQLNRLVLAEDGAVVLEERLARNVLSRLRSVAVDRDGLVYVGNDLGEIWRLRPE
jgi:glucose/arabinose dehydrogenase